MKRQLVFLPIAASEMGVLSGEIAVADRVAYTVTPRLLDEMGYDGYVGCEYRPRGRTEDGLVWLREM